MERTHQSDIFKFIHGFGQKGHQIGRKIGDALELLVLGMTHRAGDLPSHMAIEEGIEGATSACHKVFEPFEAIADFRSLIGKLNGAQIHQPSLVHEFEN